ncbi:hypothetical protein KUH03_27765 [Sphingobacterium sp. E70]|uniref:hypothetical protein n=1 Tax=Sphingobacterium sp. E70 TaxID=2853439 RepID=UPI00211BCABF|nr:hypothetical protein [Sphingobacterium sp. E70]ULT23026.1 hypothetical protein KUH03_27765 [Sphingobacterium sp. E70]
MESTGEHDKFDSLVTPYMMIGSIVVVVLLIFMVIKLPEVKEEPDTDGEENPPLRKLLQYPAFILAVAAQFLYVAAQTGTNSFFINYVIDAVHDLQTPISNIMVHLGYFGEFFMPKIMNRRLRSCSLSVGWEPSGSVVLQEHILCGL